MLAAVEKMADINIANLTVLYTQVQCSGGHFVHILKRTDTTMVCKFEFVYISRQMCSYEALDRNDLTNITYISLRQ